MDKRLSDSPFLSAAPGDGLAPKPWPYPRWIAHRGAGKLAPENTLAAFQLGASHGFRMFECDVQLSADGVPFLLHDSALERTTSGRGRADEWAWPELARLDAGAWHGPAFTGEPLLRLDTLARWLRREGLMVNLEIKPSSGQARRTGREVARAAAACWAEAPVPPLLSSFEVEALEAAKEAVTSLPRALLLERLAAGWLAQAQALDCVAVVVHHPELNAQAVAQAHEAGLKVLTYTVNDGRRADELWAQGLDGLITDAVDKLTPDPS